MEQRTNVRFISWNVKGLNGPVKRARIFNHLKYLKCEIAFIQETHLLLKDQIRLRKAWVGHVFHSSFDSKTRGTAILIHEKIQFSATTVISDPQGRFVMVSGLLFHKPVILVNIYAPNWDDDKFMGKVFLLIPDINSQQLILGGDLNCTINPILYRSNPKSTDPSKIAKSLSFLVGQIRGVDPWRSLSPLGQSYSFFSPVHHSYSRIDYFFIDRNLLPFVTKVDYSTIVESDHAPVLLDLVFPPNDSERPPWKLDKTLLADSSFCDLINKEIDNFMVSNKKDDVSTSLLWETLKVVIRGEIISYSTRINKMRRLERDQLIKSISTVDPRYSSSPSPVLYKKSLTFKLNTTCCQPVKQKKCC